MNLSDLPDLPKKPRNNPEGIRMAAVACEVDRFLSGHTNELSRLKCLLMNYSKSSVVDWITSRVIPNFQTWEPIKDNRDINLLLMLERYTMDAVRLLTQSSGDWVIDFSKMMNKPRINIVDDLSPTQRKVYLLLNACGSLAVGDVAKRLKVSRSTASRALNCLFSYGIFDRVANGRMIFYSINYKEVEFLESNLNKPKPVDKAGRWNCNRYYY